MTKSMIASVLALTLSPAVLAANAGGVKVTPLPVTHTFAPLGFDTNDNAEIVIAGYLPNPCWKAPSTKVAVNGKEISIEVTGYSPNDAEPDSPTERMCPQMIVPFLESASLGVLDKGQYKVTVNKKSDASVKIVESTSPAVDDHVYASVTSIERLENTRTVLLKGENPSSCYVFDRIEHVSNGKDTYSVLPIMKQISEICPLKLVPFTYEWNVPKDLTGDQILLHVRSMNGKSANALFVQE